MIATVGLGQVSEGKKEVAKSHVRNDEIGLDVVRHEQSDDLNGLAHPKNDEYKSSADE